MIKVIFLALLINFSASAGIKPVVKTKTYQIHNFDDSKVILKDLKGNKKWVINRSIWKEKPSIGKKVTISESLVKGLKKYKDK